MLGRRKEEVWDGSERRAPAAVLVVNDNPPACEMLVRMLDLRGFRTTGVTSAEEASGEIGSLLPRCVVLDIDAGGIGTSLKVLDHIRSHHDIRVSAARVVLCGSNPKNRTFSFQSGTDSFVLRPYHLDELVSQIDDVLGRANEDRARHRRDELARHQ